MLIIIMNLRVLRGEEVYKKGLSKVLKTYLFGTETQQTQKNLEL